MRGPLDHLSEIMTSIVDDSVGIVRYVCETSPDAGSPDFFHYYARACNTIAFCPQKNSADAGGASTDRATALAKAIGEAVERYCAAIYYPEDFHVSSFDDAPFECLAPEEFALYSDRQYAQRGFPFMPFRRSTILRWVPALDIKTGQKCHIPAATVFVPYRCDREVGELPILQPISTGLACHVGSLRASVSAICEVIERDAFTINWQARIAPAQLNLRSLSDRNRELVDRFTKIGATVTLLSLTMDHRIPVILASLRNSLSDAPALVFALSCHLNPEEAIRKSLEELAHSYRFCRLLKASRPTFTAKRNFHNVRDRDSHVALYCDHNNSHFADFLFSSNRRLDQADLENMSTGDLHQDIEVLIDRVSSVGHRILLVDLTTDDVQNLGLAVIRAVIPGFHRLCIGHHLRSLGGSRLWGVPQQLGHPGLNPLKGDNPVPHPLP
jgi:ribosomal protein S12 methylthiotransferase accessory factor